MLHHYGNAILEFLFPSFVVKDLSFLVLRIDNLVVSVPTIVMDLVDLAIINVYSGQSGWIYDNSSILHKISVTLAGWEN